MKKDYSITKHFGSNLAELLSEKILEVYAEFNSEAYIKSVAEKCIDKTYTQRVELHASELRAYLGFTEKV